LASGSARSANASPSGVPTQIAAASTRNKIIGPLSMSALQRHCVA
jgi:hypothetical protein